jgi:hypothetical protein
MLRTNHLSKVEEATQVGSRGVVEEGHVCALPQGLVIPTSTDLKI